MSHFEDTAILRFDLENVNVMGSKVKVTYDEYESSNAYQNYAIKNT